MLVHVVLKPSDNLVHYYYCSCLNEQRSKLKFGEKTSVLRDQHWSLN